MGVGSGYTSGTLSTSWTASNNVDRAIGQVNLADSTSNYINITGVQLEVGDTATPFEHRPYDVELNRCMRYFHKTQNVRYYKNSSNADFEAYPFSYPTLMRASPTITFADVSLGGKVALYSVAGSSNQSVSLQISADGTAGYARVDLKYLLDAEL